MPYRGTLEERHQRCPSPVSAVAYIFHYLFWDTRIFVEIVQKMPNISDRKILNTTSKTVQSRKNANRA